MAKVAPPRVRALLVVAVLMPLWSSYLVKVYAWRTILAEDGILNWALGPFGLSGPGFGNVATWLVFTYLWLPFMILPIYAGLERIPNSLLDASGDLGGGAGLTFRRVILPLAFPAVVAGSIFTFSLTLGDYITPQLVSSTQFIGNVVYDERRRREQPAARRGVRDGAGGDHGPLPARRAAAGRLRVALMHLSRTTRMLLRLGTGAHARVHLPAAGGDRAVRVQRAAHAEVADPRADARVVRQGVPQPGRARRAADVAQGRDRRDADRAAARHAGRVRRRALPVLRPRDDLVPGHPADRAAGHRHRHGAERHVPRGARAVRHRARPVHGDRRPRDVLHRRRSTTTWSRGCGGRRGRSRRRRPTSAPTPGTTFRLRHVPGAALGDGGGRAARVRAVVRRGDRDDVHGRPAADAADLDPHQPVAARTSCRSSTSSA